MLTAVNNVLICLVGSKQQSCFNPNANFGCSANKDLAQLWSLLCLFFWGGGEYFLQEMDKNKHADNLSIKYLNGSLVLLYYNPQGCCQSAMVARAMSLFRQEKDKGPCCPPAPPAAWGPSEDSRSITATFQYLESSGTSIEPVLEMMPTAAAGSDAPTSRLFAGWYWGPTSVGDAQEALLSKSEGTFLMRDSNHPKHMLTLSVKTCRGPTSVRIEYSRGSFWLDSIVAGQPRTQAFPDVVSLVQHYTTLGHVPQSHTHSDMHQRAKSDPSGEAAGGCDVPLKLMFPLHKPGGFPSLRHLTRLAINRRARCPDQLPLPKLLLRYLQDYPFHI